MKTAKVVLLLAVAMLIVTSCTEKEEALSDEEAIRELIEEQYADWFDFSIPMGDAVVNDTIEPDAYLAVMDTFPFIIAWGRQVTDMTMDLNVHVDNDTAFVTIERDVVGTLHVVVPPDTSGMEPEDLAKSLYDHSYRYARFVRKGDISEPFAGWVLDGISNVEVTSQPDHTVEIDSVKVVAVDGSIERVFTDPLQLWSIDSVPVFSPGDSVIVTLYAHDYPDTNCIGILHYNTPGDTHRVHHRRRFELYPDEGIMQGAWRVPEEPGIYHVWFDLIRWETFFVRDYSYDDNGWLFVYRVVEE